jgi:hypothetical protein
MSRARSPGRPFLLRVHFLQHLHLLFFLVPRAPVLVAAAVLEGAVFRCAVEATAALVVFGAVVLAEASRTLVLCSSGQLEELLAAFPHLWLGDWLP